MIALSDLEPRHEEAEPLNRPVPQSTSIQVENLEPAQANRQNPCQFCNNPVRGKCKLWMAIVSLFIVFIAMIFISLIIHEASYRDEDENEELELAANKTFLVTLKIPEECVAQEDTLSNELSTRLTTLYNSSPALSRYFASVEIADSSDNSTVAYHLHFAVPSDDDAFMKYMMSEELVLGILRQNFNDKSVTGCETLGIDPASLSLSNVRLKCTFSSFSPVGNGLTVTWNFHPRDGRSEEFVFYFHEQPYPPSAGRFKNRVVWDGNVNRNDVSIIIWKLQFNDNGTFTCQVKNPPDVDGMIGEIRLKQHRLCDQLRFSD